MNNLQKVTLLLRRSLSTSCQLFGKTRKDAKTRELLDRVIRVDHAGEFGAVRIYEGQLAVLKKTDVADTIKEMKKEEDQHLRAMNTLIPKHRVRPTVLLPLWNVAGFFLGASTALLGKNAAMACTVAVETVIGEHYDKQIRHLMADGEDGLEKHRELLTILSKFRDDELEHLDTGLKHDAEKAVLYEPLSNVIKAGCKVAIWLSERI
ncbi:hypothetical protein HELRODRAFT_114997 [Helobdella robusta]|uniref:5-demethoxyubiquinone hydroxylase, mitochondrial n=1 Tax=Helobdella robusta TaxID=6412 RepID=T1EG57_HELRO|nr:hypothetical protein HELRODRAFT_114997 [Helobdella robusta]ESN95040.1 hypothetical protein HELRODRAFT_114997 [Helobdella robusta]